MSWLTNLTRPRIATRTKRGVAVNVWEKCPACGHLNYEHDLTANLHVCGGCGHHLRWALTARLEHLLDAGATDVPVSLPPDDPLKFKDRKKYTERLKEARSSAGRPEAFVVRAGAIEGVPCVVVALDFDFMAGTMGRAVGAAVVAAADYATAHRLPLLAITASGGARMQESVPSLLQMARTTAALVNLQNAGLPYVVLLTDPTTGGVTASFAMLGDVQLAEPGALIGFAGPRVIAQTIGQQLPEGFQKAEYLLEHGMVDIVVPRNAQKTTIARVLRHLMGGATHGQKPVLGEGV
jgi:acetyl-CoA carboxylase carboxyl transferase subunit beta